MSNYFSYANPHRIRIPLRLFDEILDYFHQTIWYMINLSEVEPVTMYSNVLNLETVTLEQTKSISSLFRQHYFDCTMKIDERLKQMKKTQESLNFTSLIYFYKEKSVPTWWSTKIEKVPYIVFKFRFQVIKDSTHFDLPNIRNITNDIISYIMRISNNLPLSFQEEPKFYFEIEMEESNTPTLSYIKPLFESIPGINL